jgi:hypothetical protein
LPSTTTWTRPVAAHAEAIRRPKRSAMALGSSLAKARSNVSWLGTPFGSSRKRRKKASLARPYSATCSQPSAPAMTAQVAMVWMSLSRWSLFAASAHGSGRSANTAVRVKGIGCPPDALGVVTNPYTVSGS